MKPTQTLVSIAVALCLFASGYTGPRTFNESEKATLRQAQVIKVEVKQFSVNNTKRTDVSE